MEALLIMNSLLTIAAFVVAIMAHDKALAADKRAGMAQVSAAQARWGDKC